MGKLYLDAKTNHMTKIAWFFFIVWFCSNLLSQAAYIAVYGLPYDGISMLQSLGPIYYVAISIEVMMWLFVGGFVGKKVLNNFIL
jgi:hypothetical protein